MALLDWRHVGFMSANLVYMSLTSKLIVPIFNTFTSEVTRYMMPRAPYTLTEARDLVLDTIEAMGKGHHLTLAVLDRHSGEFLGCVAINGLDTPDPELGIWFRKEAQGQGHGTEALGAVMAWYQKRFSPAYYLYPVDKRNLSSCRLARRLGGRVTRQYEACNQRGKTLYVAEFRIPPVTVR